MLNGFSSSTENESSGTEGCERLLAHGSAPHCLPQCKRSDWSNYSRSVPWRGRDTAVWHVLTFLLFRSQLEEDISLNWCMRASCLASQPRTDTEKTRIFFYIHQLDAT